MRKRLTAGTAVLIAAAMLLTGCNGSGSEAPETTQAAAAAPDRAAEIADKFFVGGADSYPAWTDTDRSKLVASVPEGTESKDFFDITFGEFFSEYMYYLVSYKITDDMSEENKATCESYRDNIISYLTFERMYLYIAEHEYGFTEASLTEEQLGQIKSDSDEVKKNWASNFYASAEEALGEGASEEEKEALCNEVLNVILGRCGLDGNIFYKWELSRFIQELVITEMTKTAGEVTDADVQAMYDEFVSEAKDKAENDPAAYESLQAYSMVYIPEGTRTAKQIMISYADEDLTKIAQALNDGDIETVASASLEAYNDEIRAKVSEISEKLAAGTSFDELQKEYDQSGSSEMIVPKNSPSFFDAYKNALYALETKGSVSEPVIYSNGVYFIQYSDDAAVAEADVETIKSSMKSYLQDNKSQTVQNEAYTQWAKRFPYTIDYETIKVDASSSVLNETLKTAQE
ncbi:MAG: hypothetical protein K5876_02345 [Ruminiclostridium sp.]|nr:hypothetical protein [Ruminiclostridium sp.]